VRADFFEAKQILRLLAAFYMTMLRDYVRWLTVCISFDNNGKDPGR